MRNKQKPQTCQAIAELVSCYCFAFNVWPQIVPSNRSGAFPSLSFVGEFQCYIVKCCLKGIQCFLFVATLHFQLSYRTTVAGRISSDFFVLCRHLLCFPNTFLFRKKYSMTGALVLQSLVFLSSLLRYFLSSLFRCWNSNLSFYKWSVITSITFHLIYRWT